MKISIKSIWEAAKQIVIKWALKQQQYHQGGKFRYNFYEDKVYYDDGGQWEDVTESFHDALINFLTQYREIPEGGLIVSRFTHEGKEWIISIQEKK